MIALAVIGAWFVFEPQDGLSAQALHMIILFIAAMAGLMLEVGRPVAFLLIIMLVANLTGTIDVKQSFCGMSNTVPWLLFLVLSLAKVITKTTIGLRIAYAFMKCFGKGIIGISYSFTLTEFLVAPMLPSNTARGASVGLPLVTSISQYIATHVKGASEKAVGSYLSILYSANNAVCSALFFTAMISNALIMEAMNDVGVSLSWIGWFKLTIIPCGLILLLIPFVLKTVCNPGVSNLGNLREQAAKNLHEMGPLTAQEKIIIITFIAMLLMWIFSDAIGISVTVTTLLGLCVFMLLGILNIEEMLSCYNIFSSVIMLGLLISYVNCLVSLGAIDWFTGIISSAVSGFSPNMALVLLGGIYYLAHYFFSGESSKIIALYVPFLATGMALGIDKVVLAMTLAVFSSSSAVLTTYSGPVGLTMFSIGYITTKKWVPCGATLAILIMSIWFSFVFLANGIF